MEICTVGSVRGERVGVAMVDLSGHEAGNGGYSQGTPTAHRPLSYSDRRNVVVPRFGTGTVAHGGHGGGCVTSAIQPRINKRT